MRIYQRATKFFDKPVREICNKCGAERDPDDHNTPRFTAISHTYGYGSTKDMDKYVSHVCEPCMDEFYASFSIPPQVISQIIVGEDPGPPVQYTEESPQEDVVRQVLVQGPASIQNVLLALGRSYPEDKSEVHQRLLREMIETGKIDLDLNMELVLRDPYAA